MKLKNNEAHMSLSFTLFYDQIREAHAIYQKHCFSCDFINRCSDRRQKEIGLCNLPYETLPDEAKLLDTAYRIYGEKEDCNVAYNDTLDAVIKEIERQIADGRLVLPSVPAASRVSIVTEDGIISATFSSDSNIRIEITELDKNYADSEQRDAVYFFSETNPDGLRSLWEDLITPSGTRTGDKLEHGQPFVSSEALLMRFHDLGYMAASLEDLASILEDSDIYIHVFEDPYKPENQVA